jgi:hypothetical protein
MYIYIIIIPEWMYHTLKYQDMLRELEIYRKQNFINSVEHEYMYIYIYVYICIYIYINIYVQM